MALRRGVSVMHRAHRVAHGGQHNRLMQRLTYHQHEEPALGAAVPTHQSLLAGGRHQFLGHTAGHGMQRWQCAPI